MTPEYSDYLAHFGIRGQKWGVRNYQNEDGSLTDAGRARYGVGDKKDWKRLRKDAENDAREYARAKAYYGEGAGNRRKRIKNMISERMKDPDYKAEFERQLQNQDMEKAQLRANRERKFNDAKNTAVRTTRGVTNFLLGNAVPMTMAAVAIGTLLTKTGAGEKIKTWGSRKVSSIASAGRAAKSKAKLTIDNIKMRRMLNRMRR